MPKQTTVYTLTKLKKSNPEAYTKVYKEWLEDCESEETPWVPETMDSLKAVITACRFKLTNWSIGPYDGWVDVEETELLNDDGDPITKDRAWFESYVLDHNKYQKDSAGIYQFPGLCPWTGYCADECFIESVYKDMLIGFDLKPALKRLAKKASKLMEEDLEQMKEEESMLANWGDNYYTLDGKRI